MIASALVCAIVIMWLRRLNRGWIYALAPFSAISIVLVQAQLIVDSLYAGLAYLLIFIMAIVIVTVRRIVINWRSLRERMRVFALAYRDDLLENDDIEVEADDGSPLGSLVLMRSEPGMIGHLFMVSSGLTGLRLPRWGWIAVSVSRSNDEILRARSFVGYGLWNCPDKRIQHAAPLVIRDKMPRWLRSAEVHELDWDPAELSDLAKRVRQEQERETPA